MIPIRFQMTGDVEIQKLLLTRGSALRLEVTKAIRALGEAGTMMARNAAPVGGRFPNKKYGHGNIPRGIQFYMAGDEIGRDVDSRRILAETLNSPGAITGVIHSNWFTGRFFETGINVMASNTARKKRQFRGTYERLYKRFVSGSMRRDKRGRVLAVLARSEDLAKRMALAAARKKTGVGAPGERRYFVPKRPFMEPARQMVEMKFEDFMQTAIDKALAK